MWQNATNEWAGAQVLKKIPCVAKWQIAMGEKWAGAQKEK